MGVGLRTVFPQGTTTDQAAAVEEIRVTVKRASDDAVLAVCVESVDPTLTEWVVTCEFEATQEAIYLTFEAVNAVGAVEFSGVTAEFVLTAQTQVQEAQLVHGPLSNNFVTSLTLLEAGPVTEGDGLQLQAQVQMSEPGTPTLIWDSSNSSIATVTQGGFLQAHLPGPVDITVLAGTESASLSLLVLPRVIALAFVTQPGAVEVDQPLEPAPSVEAVDARGDRVASYTGSITLELQNRAAAVVAAAAAAAPGEVGAPQAAELNGTTTVDAVAGLATFEGLVSPDAGLFRLFATAQGLNPATSQDFEVSLLTADIAVTKVVDKPTALEGDLVTFTVTVVNNGPATATGVKVDDPEPYGMFFETMTPSSGSVDPVGAWDVGSLAPGASATLTIVATLADGTGGETLENVASAAQLTDQTDDPSNNVASALVDVGRRVADIAVTKEADQVEVHEAEEVVFTIAVTNHGPDRADHIVVTDHLPPGLQFVRPMERSIPAPASGRSRAWPRGPWSASR